VVVAPVLAGLRVTTRLGLPTRRGRHLRIVDQPPHGLPHVSSSLSYDLGAGAPARAEGLAHAHTAGPAVALESVRLPAASTALFVSAGAAITVAVAL